MNWPAINIGPKHNQLRGFYCITHKSYWKGTLEEWTNSHKRLTLKQLERAKEELEHHSSHYPTNQQRQLGSGESGRVPKSLYFIKYRTLANVWHVTWMPLEAYHLVSHLLSTFLKRCWARYLVCIIHRPGIKPLGSNLPKHMVSLLFYRSECSKLRSYKNQENNALFFHAHIRPKVTFTRIWMSKLALHLIPMAAFLGKLTNILGIFSFL